MPTISLCLITKNEEAYLENCLNSVKDIIDEIIIVDTGSTDKTLDIAKKFNAKIIKKPWNNSFSEARNESLKHATKDWILVLDADETITKEDLKKIKELTENNEFTGYMLIQRSYTNDSSSIKWVSAKDDTYKESKQYSGWVYSGITRLFKNDKRIQFQYPVHETVKESIKKFGKIKPTEIPIHHYGKVKPKQAVDEKSKMYLELGKEKLKENKPKFYYELGIQALVLNKQEEAITNLKKAIELNKQWAAPYISLGTVYCRQKEFDKAINTLKQANEISPDDSNIHNNLGVAYENLNNAKSALDEYKKAITLNKMNADAYNNLARLLLRLNHVDDVIKILNALIKIKPRDINNYSNLGALYLKKGMVKEAIEILNESLKIGVSPDTLSNLAVLHIQQKNYKKALELFNEALKISPNDEEIKKNIEKLKKIKDKYSKEHK